MLRSVLDAVYADAILHTEKLMDHQYPTNPPTLADTIVTFEKLIDELTFLRLHLENAHALIALVRASRVAFVHGDAGARAGACYDLKSRVHIPLLVASSQWRETARLYEFAGQCATARD
jgi:hypothetical protein